MLESEDRKSKTKDEVFEEEIATREVSKVSIDPKIDNEMKTPEVLEVD